MECGCSAPADRLAMPPSRETGAGRSRSLPKGLERLEPPKSLVVRQERDLPSDGIGSDDPVVQLRSAKPSELGPSLLGEVRPDEIFPPAKFVEQFVRPRGCDEPNSPVLRQPEEFRENDLGKEQRTAPRLGFTHDRQSARRESALEEAHQRDRVQDRVRQGLVSRRRRRIERSSCSVSIRPLRSPYRL